MPGARRVERPGAAAERLGFTFESFFHQANIAKGRNRNTAWYSLPDNEWPDAKAAFQALVGAGELRPKRAATRAPGRLS